MSTQVGADPLEEPLRVAEEHPAHARELVGEEPELLGVGRRGTAGAGRVGVHRREDSDWPPGRKGGSAASWRAMRSCPAGTERGAGRPAS